MPCCESLSLEGIEEHDEQLELSLQLCHTVDKDRSIGWHQVNKRTQRSRYAALSCLSAISCAVAGTDSAALPSSSFRLFFLPPPQLATTSFNLQRSPRRFFLSVLSGPRVGQSTRIIALRARARSDTCRDHRPPSCTLGHRLTTLSFHRFYERNQPIIPHVICPTRWNLSLGIQYNTMLELISNPGARGYKTATPLTIAPFSLSRGTHSPSSLYPSIYPSIYLSFDPSFDTIERTTRIFTIGDKVFFYSHSYFLFFYARFENNGIGCRSNLSLLLCIGGRIGACSGRGQRVCNHGARSVGHD